MTRFLIVFLLALGLALATTWPAPVPAQAQAQEDGGTQAYVVQKGDTLAKIAKKFYGKANLGQRLWRANQNVVAHPKRLTPGDVLYIFPESTLALNRPISVPPAPASPPQNLYPKQELLDMSFPKYFSFVTDLQSHPNTTRVRVKKLVSKQVFQYNPTLEKEELVTNKYLEDQLYEARIIGEILASQERGGVVRNDGLSAVQMGRTLLSTGDNVIIRFTDDLTKIMDSDTYEDSDPYFSSFPIYSISNVIQEPDRRSPSFARSLGNLMYYKGKITIVSRIEGLAPPPPADTRKMKHRDRPNQDLESVSYVARITYSEDAIAIGDKVVLFLPLRPGPERRLDAPYVEERDSYRAPGR
ncbi:MAG: LysM peptidoglycan-binding domain-containing protein [Deltaproteobacteria bacterium]|nr:LysM peptidoglycan-binding domain-containing protein [Deltaproteobacteria bacterium]